MVVRLTKLIVYFMLIVMIIAGIGAAVWTIIPDSSTYPTSSGREVSDLGYQSHCPIAPYSTIASVAVALFGIVAFVIARRFWR